MAHVTGIDLSQGTAAAHGAHEQSTERTRLTSPADNDENGSSAFVAKAYHLRWFVLVVFALNVIVTNLLWATTNPIAEILACYYGVGLWWINALSWICMLTYVLLFIPGAQFLDVLGLRAAIIASACFNAAGSWFRFAGSGKRKFAIVISLSLNCGSLCQILARSGY